MSDSPLVDELGVRLFEPLGVNDTELVNNYRAGFVGSSSGGVVSTLDDIATWYDASVSDRRVLCDVVLDEMIWGRSEHADSAGLGAWRHCPCRGGHLRDARRVPGRRSDLAGVLAARGEHGRGRLADSREIDVVENVGRDGDVMLTVDYVEVWSRSPEDATFAASAAWCRVACTRAGLLSLRRSRPRLRLLEKDARGGS